MTTKILLIGYNVVFVVDGFTLASYPGSLIIAGEEKRACFQSLTHAPIAPEFWGDSILQ